MLLLPDVSSDTVLVAVEQRGVLGERTAVFAALDAGALVPGVGEQRAIAADVLGEGGQGASSGDDD